jgi:hypothetical protein
MPEESTTPDLVDLMRAVIEASGVEETMRFFGPASVYDLSVMGVGVFEGYDTIRGFLEEWLSSYDESEDEAEEITEFGNGVVLAVIRGKARPAGSPAGVQVTARRNAVAVWADDLIVRITIYRDIDEARAAAERLAQERG